MRLKNKVAIVTGAGSGIGKAIVFSFAKEGANVAVVDLYKDRADKVSVEIKKIGVNTISIKADVSSIADVVDMVNETIDKLGRIDILVNNAGIILQSKVVDTKEEDWDRILRNNLKSCFLCCREVAKQMIKQYESSKKTDELYSGGKIINISSIHATLSEPQAGAYTAAKGGMEAFSRTLATELAKYKINVNCIEPGATYTELTIPMYTEQVKKSLYERIPWKEIAEPSWIANSAVFLASEESYYITGQVIVVDGGYIMDGSLPGAQYWTE